MNLWDEIDARTAPKETKNQSCFSHGSNLSFCDYIQVYEQPEKSTVGYLLEDSQRELVADAVNAFVLSVNPNLKDRKSCLQSHLEKLWRQLTACFLERRSLNGDQGEAFHIRRILEASVRRV
ncbi:SPla/RYanodine receptor (SPRY) domain-containing protein [Heracleum sosnowskyi]|uniref:SPla/RYanodine receptor (SPRY) domain-containing protein n=1 Tax=Heracleum sosnowskyi TaxID=360622 RepID=A0AAD8MHC6_9APIA|nr:SPla/RYanodine receptor (SPRY) domain-containing protein [Heracleum sosnowskyi]